MGAMLPRTYAVFLLTILLTACAPAQSALPANTETPTQVATATPTIDWFPATPTHTPMPTSAASPTPDLHPGIGDLLLDENFSTDESWNTIQSDNSSALVANGRFTLRTEQNNGFVMSVYNEVGYRDIYAEITASPSLCKGEDEYGLVVRDDASGDHYRFALSCDGRAKVDRYQGGSLIAHEPWVGSLAVPDAAPSESRLAVWANGSQMRFFVNDALVLSTSDSVFFAGLIGVFIRQDGEGTLSVSFSDLRVWELEG
jgi:hypothetical protein